MFPLNCKLALYTNSQKGTDSDCEKELISCYTVGQIGLYLGPTGFFRMLLNIFMLNSQSQWNITEIQF